MTRLIRAVHNGPRLIKARDLNATPEQALAEAATTLAKALQRESNRRAQLNHELHAALITLSMAIAKQLIARTLQAQPHALLELVEPLLAALQSASTLRIEAEPEDAALLRQTLEPILAEYPQDVPTVIIESCSNLSRGSLRIDSDVGALDGQLETRLSLIAQRLAKVSEALP